MFITYAQNREDVILDAYFKNVKEGFYVDIGANHPVKDSVTKHFYEHGWRGINVEPIAELFNLLSIDRPDDINLNLGISNKEGELVLRKYANDGLSTFSKSMKEDYLGEDSKKTSEFEDITVKVITLKNLFDTYKPKHIHFLKIDAEGTEYQVVEGNDWKKYRPEVICIESNHGETEWSKLLTSHGYEKMYNDGLNEYYVAKESRDIEKNFSYIDTILLGPQIMPYHVQDRIDELTSALKNSEITIEIQSIHLKQLEKEKHETERQIIEQKRFIPSLKAFVNALDKLIIARMENLRKPKASKKVVGNQTADSLTYNTTSRNLLLDSIRKNDIQTLYSRQSRNVTERVVLYRITKFIYSTARKIAIFPYRLLKKITKRGDSDD